MATIIGLLLFLALTGWLIAVITDCMWKSAQ